MIFGIFLGPNELFVIGRYSICTERLDCMYTLLNIPKKGLSASIFKIN